MVCAPLVEYLYRDENLSINVCSEFKEQADQLANQYPGIKSTYLNIMENPSHLTELCGIIYAQIYLKLSIKVKPIFWMGNPSTKSCIHIDCLNKFESAYLIKNIIYNKTN